MRLHRFYINQSIEKGKEIRIDNPELLHQWIKVFRLSSSDRVIVFNGNGKEYEGYFRVLTKKEAVLFLDKEKNIENNIKTRLHIFQSIIKKDNFELIIQKGTEIGVSAFHPIISERSEKKDLNIERLNKIAVEASEQSGRGSIPEIFNPKEMIESISDFKGKLFVLDFDGKNISDIKFSNEEVGILIGPEGGWSDEERKSFKKLKIETISVGNNVLRAETATVVVSALVLLK
jgi:16S rRNA (uracil1498-N3)-methyltransferase